MSRQSVLIVDDHHDTLSLLGDYIDMLGFEVTAAKTALEAIEKLEAIDQLHAIVSDVYLPNNIDGLQLVTRIKTRHPGALAILLTGLNPSAVMKSPDYNPSFNILRKPISLDELAEFLLCQQG